MLLRGPIYEIAIDDIVRCRVWRDARVDAATGARCAEEILAHLRSHGIATSPAVRGIIFDMRDGPAAFGPRTQAALKKIFSEMTAGGRRIAVLAADNAIQRMQFGRICADVAPDRSVVVRDEEAAVAFVELRT